MRKAILRAAMLAAALAGADAALAQNAAAPAAPSAAPAAEPSPPGPIAALQQQLKEQGFAPGPVNGVMTDKTRQALVAYERRTRRLPEALAAAGPGGAAADPVRRAQMDLQRLGMLRAPADGVVGPATRDAIINFQASRHLAVDPRVSDALLAALDEAGARAAAPAAPPSAATAEQAAPAAAAAEQAAPAGTTPEAPANATGRRPLPAGVNPPPIR